jgi:ACR3 family arsenite efflux pump ArsB
MAWYTLLTIFAEVIQHIAHLPPNGHFSIFAARCLMYFGFISFIPFILAYVSLLKHEKENSPNQSSEVTPKPGAPQ